MNETIINKKAILLEGFKYCEDCSVIQIFKKTAYKNAMGIILDVDENEDVEITFEDKEIKGNERIAGNEKITSQWICSKHFKLFSILDVMREKASID